MVDHTLATQALVGFGSPQEVDGSGPVLGAGLPVVSIGAVRLGVVGLGVVGLGVLSLAVVVKAAPADCYYHVSITVVAYTYALESVVKTALASFQGSLCYCVLHHRTIRCTESTSVSRRTCIWDQVS